MGDGDDGNGAGLDSSSDDGSGGDAGSDGGDAGLDADAAGSSDSSDVDAGGYGPGDWSSSALGAVGQIGDPSADADPQRARVTGWYAVCMFVFPGGRRCGYSEYSIDQQGANANKQAHIASNPDHANAVVVQEST